MSNVVHDYRTSDGTTVKIEGSLPITKCRDLVVV